MSLVITDETVNGRRAVRLVGNAEYNEMLAAIESLIHGHIQSLMNIGCPRQSAVDLTAREIAKILCSSPNFADGSSIATVRKGGRE